MACSRSITAQDPSWAVFLWRRMAASQHYLGLWSAFGEIIEIENRFYNPTAKVRARDGSVSNHQLPKLIAFGLREESNGERKHPRKTA